MAEALLRIIGAPGSPYSRKLRAVLRYRRIPYAWLQRGTPEARGLPRPKVELLPQLIRTGADGALDGAHRLDAADPRARARVRGALGDPERSGRRVPRRAARRLRRRVAHQGDVPLPLGVCAGHRAGGRDPAALVPHRRAGGRGARGRPRVLGAPDRAPRRRGLERRHRAGDRGELRASAEAPRRALERAPLRDGSAAGRERLRPLRSAHPARGLRPDVARARAAARAARDRLGGRRRGSLRSRAAGGRLARPRRACPRRCARCSARSDASTRRSCSRTPRRSRAAPSGWSA